MTVDALIQTSPVAKASPAFAACGDTKAQVCRRRLHRSWLLLQNGISYTGFFARLHFSSAGSVLYRHSHVFDRKFLGPYLSTHLGTREKLAIQKHFLRFADTAFARGPLIRLLPHGICIWRRTAEGDNHRIILRLSDATKFEGDLLLEYFYNGERLHSLSFVFAPGRVFNMPDAHVAFIGGSQGANGRQSEARAAARGTGGIHSANMLLLALRAICQSLDVTGICGVSSYFQLLNHTNQSPRDENYDRLWSMNDGQFHGHSYSMSATLHRDDEAELTGTHRTRRRRRRRLRQEIITEIVESLQLSIRAADHAGPIPDPYARMAAEHS
ncbi:MAG: DUF535 domain-containing protein [Proteobacteria bacterium]|nr:DUF535 domain-containing protein [Pseudomonadota bacterium]